MRIGFYVAGGDHALVASLRGAARAAGHELVVRNGTGLVAADFETDLGAVMTDEACARSVLDLYADRAAPGDRMYRPGRVVIEVAGDEDPADLIATVASKASAPAPEPSPKAAAVADALAKLDESDAPIGDGIAPSVDVPVANPAPAADPAPEPSPKGKAKR